jgi:hypothetical protein
VDELAKAGADVVSGPAKEFLTKVAGTPGSELGNILGDRLRLRRWKNALKMAEQAQAFAAERGLDPQEVPLSVLFPILEGGATEEHEDMSQRWAAMLANAADPTIDVSPAMPAILRELSPNDCRILDRFAYLLTLDPWPEKDQRVAASVLNAELKLASRAFQITMDNLIRLRLVRPIFETALAGSSTVYENEEHFCISYLGGAFLKACGWWEANADTIGRFARYHATSDRDSQAT